MWLLTGLENEIVMVYTLVAIIFEIENLKILNLDQGMTFLSIIE